MITKNYNNDGSANLRKKAEELLRLKKLDKIETVSESDMLKLIHELEVHQIELELQNEELILSNMRAIEATEKYEELYDFAPSGYFSLSSAGDILEMNLRGALMLGKERSLLINSHFALFIKEDSRVIFSNFLEEIFQGKKQANCDLSIISKDNNSLYVHLTGIVSENPDKCYLTAIDITERKEIDYELLQEKERVKESTEKYRLLHENAGLGIGYYSPEGVVISYNKMAAKHLNGKPEDFAGKSIFDLFPKSEAEFYFNRIRQAINSSEPNLYEDYVQLPNEEKWFLSAFTKIVDSKNKVIGIQIISNDITKLKSTEIELIKAKERAEESEEKYRALFYNAPLSYQSLDENGYFLDINPMWLKTLGYEKYEVIGKWYGDFLHPDFVEHFRINFPAFKKRGYVSDVQFRLRRKDNTYIYVSFEGCIGYTPEGKFKQTYCVFKDITDQKAFDNELQKAKEIAEESEKRFDLAMKASNDGLFDWNLVTNDIYFSPGWKKMLGYEDDELPNEFSTWENNIEPEDLKKSWELQQQLISKQIDRFVLEFKMQHKAGHWVDILSRAEAFFDKDGKAIRIVGTHTDITERKKSEVILKDLIEKNPMSIQILDMEGYPIHANPAHTNLFGVKVPPDYSVLKDTQLLSLGFDKLFDQIKKGGVVYFPDSYYNVHDIDPSFPDSPLWVKALGFTLNDNNGIPNKIVLMHENITQRKNADALLNDIIDNNPMSIQVVDKDGHTISWNPSFIKLFGTPPPPEFSIFEDLTSKSTDLANLVSLVKEGEIVHLPVIYFNAHDAITEAPDIPLWIRALIFPLKNSAGKPDRFVFMYENITEQKQAEKALQDSESTFRKLFEESSDAILLIDETGVFVECNQAALDLLKMTREQFLFLSPVSISPEFQPNGDTSIEYAKEMIELAYKKGLNRFDWTHCNAEGEEFIVDVSLMPIVLKEKTMLYTTWRNITEQKKAEEALRQSEEKMSSIYNIAPSGIGLVKERVIYEVNPKVCEMTGYTREELVDNNSIVLYPTVEEYDFVGKEKYRQIKETGTGRVETIWRKKDGSIINIILSSTPIDINYFSKGIIFTALDISELKLAEESLQNTFEILSLFIKHSPIYTFLKVVSDNESRVLFVSDNFQEMVGITAKEMSNKTMYEIFPHEFAEKITNDDIMVVNEGKNLFIEEELNGKYYLTYKFPILQKEKKYLAGYTIDITNRKLTEEELLRKNIQLEQQYEEYMQLNEVLRRTNYDMEIAKEKAEESDKLKSAFLANMSHEIRTPMNGILGFVNLLKDSNITSKEQQDYIQIINNSGKRMLSVINDIIDISKIESGLMKLDLWESNINEQIEFIYTFFRPEVEAKNMKLSFNTSLSTKDSVITTDREKVFAILTNLVKNAIKYTNNGSIEFGYRNTVNYLEFYVKDTGIGIPQDRLEAIFERFIQADIHDRMARHGAGLGLAISKAYVEMLGGRIWVESKEGIGSTFYFTLPYVQGID